MACNNRNYKSAVQFYDSTQQPILATNLVANPVVFDFGTKVTDTGCAIDLDGNTIEIDASGLYRISADINVVGVTAGNLTFAMTLDGNILPETIRTQTMIAGNTMTVPIETIRRVSTCAAFDRHNFGIIAYSDATGAGTVTRISGNAVKLA